MRGVKGKILLSVISCTLSLGIIEIGLRLFLAERLAEVPRNEESLFWHQDPILGWVRLPHIEGEFTNGYFSGRVTTTDMGIRSNGTEWLDGAATIFFIGDSTVASLEVDDDQTVPAQLERRLRDAGHRMNVVNLGVRGYGTDQAVTIALRAAQKIPPDAVIYMYMENDVFNNNTLKNPFRAFGKSAYVRDADQSFVEYNSPVPKYGFDDAGFVHLDRACKPNVVEGTIEGAHMRRSRFFSGRTWSHLKTHVYVARLLEVLRERRNRKIALELPDNEVDLEVAIASGDLFFGANLENLYYNTGEIRERCHDYFTDQMGFLLGRLRVIAGLDAVFAVEWPSSTTRDYLEINRAEPPSTRMLNTLVDRGVLDGTVFLNDIGQRENMDFGKFACPGDPHFCDKGNEWIATRVEPIVTEWLGATLPSNGRRGPESIKREVER